MDEIERLVGRVFCDRKFRLLPVDEAMAGFQLPPDQEKAFRQAFANPELRAAVDEVWRVYDEQRAAGAIAEASPWYG